MPHIEKLLIKLPLFKNVNLSAKAERSYVMVHHIKGEKKESRDAAALAAKAKKKEEQKAAAEASKK
ncbi:CLUMA_CG014463, isoform A [Clunio marinus]|uniref:CLUMA_CG014463, isoform A n=1 Tax=Clunio marinus TaxID=568069 RepID=A0A1J1ILE1_9DIPT|nr:CLUMA_CG014463, isoform A [Clunio marinus]